MAHVLVIYSGSGVFMREELKTWAVIEVNVFCVKFKMFYRLYIFHGFIVFMAPSESYSYDLILYESYPIWS